MAEPRSRKAAYYSDQATRPSVLAVDLDGIPAELRAEPRWCLWRLVWKDRKGGGKWDKPPFQPNGRTASSTDPATWSPFETVAAAYQKGGWDGIGYMLGDGWAGIDLDDVRDPATGELSAAALDLIGRAGTYCETSPSDTGVKLFGLGRWRADWHRKQFPVGTSDGAGEIEVYDSGRYFTVTGRAVARHPVADIQSSLDKLAGVAGAPPLSVSDPTATDGELIDAACRAANGEKFRRLWDGDTTDHGGDESRADLALAGMLAFWCGGDAARVDRLFRRSKLMRPKWDERRGGSTYGAQTIAKALAGKTEFYGEPSANGHRGPRAVLQTTPRGWGLPAPLPTMPAVPPFPLRVFPAKVADYWQAAAAALACPVDYVAVPGLTLLGAAAGRSRAGEVKPGYTDVPLFWTAVIAPPGGTKSPALRVARAPLQRAEVGWMGEHRDRVMAFEIETDRYAARVKDWKANGCQGDPPEKPRRPTLRQATLDDTTTEATAKVLADNPRGLAVVKDELIGFVRSMNQYRGGGKGADREFWLSAWAGATAKVNRSKDHDAGPLYIPHPFVAVAGMMCPDALGELRGEDRRGDAQADGFLDRFLLSFPDPLDAKAESWQVIPTGVEQGYCEVFLDLLGMELVAEGDGPGSARLRPYPIGFSPDGRRAWEEFTGDMAARMNALDKLDPFRGVLSKLRGYAVRFATLLWCVGRVCGRAGPDDLITAETMIGAAALVDYFERHAARCLGRGWADRTSRVAHRLLAWLVRDPDRAGFNRTEAFIALKDRRDVRTSEALAPAFRLLTDHGYIRPLERPESARPGPVPETYAVNPDWDRSIPG